MNVEGTKITGMISVCTGANGGMQFGYEIDLSTNKVCYVTRGFRKDWPDNPEWRMTQWNDYNDARRFYDACREIVGKAVAA